MLKLITFRLVSFLLLLVIPYSSANAWDLGKLGQFSFQKLTKNVYVMHGPLGEPSAENQGFMNNPGLIVLEKGLVLVDPGATAHVGRKVLEEVEKVSKKPVLAVFNTHIHGDHWLGNQAIVAKWPDVKIYGHPRMIERIENGDGKTWTGIMVDMVGDLAKDTRVTPPNQKTEAGQLIKVGGESFRIHSGPPAHTDSDIMVEHVESKTIFLGDNGFVHRLGRFEESGHIHGNIDALKAVQKLELSWFVPGHGPSGNEQKALLPFLNYMGKLRKSVTEGYRAEQQDFQIRKRIMPSFRAFQAWKGFEANFGKHVSKMYVEVEEKEF